MILRIKDVLLQLSFCIWFYAEFNRFGDQIPIIEFFRLNETGAPFIALMCKYFRLPSYIQWTNYYIITLLHYPIARTYEGPPRPKYIFNKCGTNIYFFILQRFGPSPSLNFKLLHIDHIDHCFMNTTKKPFFVKNQSSFLLHYSIENEVEILIIEKKFYFRSEGRD